MEQSRREEFYEERDKVILNEMGFSIKDEATY